MCNIILHILLSTILLSFNDITTIIITNSIIMNNLICNNGHNNGHQALGHWRPLSHSKCCSAVVLKNDGESAVMFMESTIN